MTSNKKKLHPLLSSLSVQFSPLLDEQSFQDTIARRKRNIRKGSFQTTLISPREEDEDILQICAPNEFHMNMNIGNDTNNNNLNGCKDIIVKKSNTTNSLITKCKYGSNNHKKRSSLVVSIIEDRIDELLNRIISGDNIDEEDEEGFKPLHYACKMGHLQAVKLLLKEGCDMLASNADRVSSLHIAVRAGKEGVVSLLLEEGVIPDVREKIHGRTPIHEATMLPNSQILSAIISKLQEDPWEARRILKISDKNGQTALHLAANSSMPEAVGLLLAAGADVATTDNNGLTPMHLSLISHKDKKQCGGILTQLLEAGGEVEVEGVNKERLSHLAAKVGCPVCLEFLRIKGADLMAKDRLGRTPLHLAALEGKNDAVRYLLSRNVDIEDVDENGLRPIHHAITNDHSRIIQFMIESQVNPEVLDSEGRTYIQIAILKRKLNAFQILVKSDFVHLDKESNEDIIHYCSALGFIDFIRILLINDWDINLRDLKGRTALHRCLNHGHENLATFLINNGASLHVVDVAGATPLHYAVRWGGSDAILRLMIKKKANMNIRDRLGRTPLHYAASKFSIMSDLYILLGGGSSLNTQDQMGLTPLHLAARLGNESLVRILLENGAKHDIKDIDKFLPIDHAIENSNTSIVARLKEHDHRKNSNAAANGIKNTLRVNNTTKNSHRKSVAW